MTIIFQKCTEKTSLNKAQVSSRKLQAASFKHHAVVAGFSLRRFMNYLEYVGIDLIEGTNLTHTPAYTGPLLTVDVFRFQDQMNWIVSAVA